MQTRVMRYIYIAKEAWYENMRNVLASRKRVEKGNLLTRKEKIYICKLYFWRSLSPTAKYWPSWVPSPQTFEPHSLCHLMTAISHPITIQQAWKPPKFEKQHCAVCFLHLKLDRFTPLPSSDQKVLGLPILKHPASRDHTRVWRANLSWLILAIWPQFELY